MAIKRLMFRPELLDVVAMSYPTIWKLMRQNRFPRSRETSDGRVAWIASEVETWIDELPVKKLKGEYRKVAVPAPRRKAVA